MALHEQELSSPQIKSVEHLWRMQRLLNHMGRPFDSAKGKEFQLTLPQYNIMRTIAFFPDITAQEVSEYEGVNSMLVSRAVTVLSKRGWLERIVDETDRRKMLLRLTDEGRAAFEQVFPFQQARHRFVLSPLADSERDVFGQMLRQLMIHMRSATWDGKPLEEAEAQAENSAEKSLAPPTNKSTDALANENELLRAMLVDLKLENYLLKQQLESRA